MWQKLSKCYPPQFELIALFLLFLNFYLVWQYYPSLPFMIPSHFDFLGRPDSWHMKSSILIQPLIAGVMYLVFTVINLLLALLKDPRGIINLPLNRKAVLTEAQLELLRVFMGRSLFALKVFMQALFTYIVYATIEVALERADRLGAPFFLILAGLLGVAGYMVWMSFRITRPRQSP